MSDRNLKEATVKNNQGISKGGKPPKYRHKNIYPDNLDSLYKPVTVCKACLQIYTILSEFFDNVTSKNIENENAY